MIRRSEKVEVGDVLTCTHSWDSPLVFNRQYTVVDVPDAFGVVLLGFEDKKFHKCRFDKVQTKLEVGDGVSIIHLNPEFVNSGENQTTIQQDLLDIQLERFQSYWGISEFISANKLYYNKQEGKWDSHKMAEELDGQVDYIQGAWDMFSMDKQP